MNIKEMIMLAVFSFIIASGQVVEAKNQQLINRDEVLEYIQKNINFINNHTRNEANSYYKMVLSEKVGISKSQRKIIFSIFENIEKPDAIFDQGSFIYLALRSPWILKNHARVFNVIARGAKEENDFNEDVALSLLFRTPRLTDKSSDKLISIFQNAKYENGIDDTFEFLKALGI